jgi:GDP-L-fucose synthase
MDNPPDIVNVGSGIEITIRELAEKIKLLTGCTANIIWDKSKPDGTPRKFCDTSLIRCLGWYPKIDLDTGIKKTIIEYRNSIINGSIRI